MISRTFEGLPREEIRNSVEHLRVPSYNAPANRFLYRVFDLLYAIRVSIMLPASDVTVTNSVALPLILPRSRAGKIYVSVARFPKGQMGWYSRANRLQAVSSHIEAAIWKQSPSVRHLTKTIPNCMSEAFASAAEREQSPRSKEVVFVGRIAREKGIHLLIRAFASLKAQFPDWRLKIVGPHQVHQGGDGEEYLRHLKELSNFANGSIEFVGPIFEEHELIRQLRRAEIFVYPSVASEGESFGLAPLEAMACGCAVLLSELECFSDYFSPETNGISFEHGDSTAQSLARALDRLMSSPELRRRLSAKGLETSKRFSPNGVAGRFLDDFETLVKTGA
jgi:glycosyltransferase involved in cell wall biosynthesis